MESKFRWNDKNMETIRNLQTILSRLRRRVAAWTIRISWPAALLWGCFDLYTLLTRSLPPEQFARQQEDATLRIGAGLVVFALWFFVIRTRGPWTLNRDGRLER